MSTSFYPSPKAGAFVLECAGCGTQSIQQLSSMRQTEALLTSLVTARGATTRVCPVCGGCAAGMLAAAAHVADHQEVNLASGNAVLIAEALGLTASDLPIGAMDAADFLGRVLIALAVAPSDAGVPAHSAISSGLEDIHSDRWKHCGRPVGYLQETLTELHDVAQVALRAGVQICWS